MALNSEKGFVLWFTGLPSSGKTTLAKVIETRLKGQGLKVESLDGDEVRKGLSSDLGFSKKDRETHAQRVAYLAKVLARNDVVAIASLISPYRESRLYARAQIGDGFIEIWTRCSIQECIKRDVKGLYKKALEGKITDMTGVQDPYEEPVNNEIIVDTEHSSVDCCANKIMQYLITNGYISNTESQTLAA